MSDKTRTETSDRAASRPGGANAPAPRTAEERRTREGVKVEGVSQDRQDVSQDLQPLKAGHKTEPLSAAAPMVAKFIKDNNLEVISVASESQDEQLAQLKRDNTVTASEINDGGRRRPRRDTLPQQRQWYSDIPANPNDLLRSNHGGSDAVTG
jgi:hypothetical protein